MDKKPFNELGLAPEMLEAVAALGFDQPSPIQAQAIPPALEGNDVVGQSQTGSGKTMAFAIPAVQSIQPQERGQRVLILCPTRELAMQVCEQVHKLAAHKAGVKAVPIYGGATYDRQVRGLRDGAQIVVGTPGRILDLVDRGLLKLDAIRLLVFDEADEMLDMGFREDIETLMEHMPAERQTLFFSATFEGQIRRLINSYTKDAVMVTIEHKALTVPTIEQIYFEVHNRSKAEVLCRVLDLENPKLALVFANTKRSVDDVTDALLARGYSADRLHGDLNQQARERVMKNFRAGTIEVLVATDVAARGLDVDDIDLVVNFEPPYDEEDYVHRIGRTGRAGRSGKAISFVGGREIFLLQRIMRYARVQIARKRVPTREAVEGARTDAHFEKLRETLESGSFNNDEATIQRLLDAGHSPTDIASAAVHLWLADSARESEEIMEDRVRERPERKEKPAREPREAGPRARTAPEAPQEGYSRLFLNVGRRDDASPRDIAGAVYRAGHLPEGCLGRIEMFEQCSFVAVPTEYADQLIEAIADSAWHGRRLRMDFADNQGPAVAGGRPRPSGPPRGRGFRDEPRSFDGPPRGRGGFRRGSRDSGE